MHDPQEGGVNEHRLAVVCAAVTAAGPATDDPVGWEQRVLDLAGTIAAWARDGSPASRVIDGVAAAKMFPGVVVKVERERSSTRALVTLRTRPSDHHPDGIESCRSERTDSPDGLALARQVQALIGHRVLAYVEVEQLSAGKAVRVLRHVVDLGLDHSSHEEEP